MVPVNEAGSQGQPNLLIGNLPPVSIEGAPTISQPRIYFGERPSSYVVTGAQEDEFDYPTGDTDTGRLGRRADALDGDDRDRARHDAHAPAVRRAVPGPRPADQRPGHQRQPAPVPSQPGRPAGDDRPVPALRQGSLPGHRRRRPAGLHPGRVHDLRPVPRRPGVRPDDPDRRRAWAATTSTTSATASRSRWTPTTARCTSTSPIRTTRSSAPTRASSRRCSSRSPRCRPTSAPTFASPRSCSTSRPGSSGAIT